MSGQVKSPQIVWEGKDSAFEEAFSPFTGYLVECPEESLSHPDGGNLFIEGDNLHAMKLLLPEYKGQVKMIYIDPPYNTGNKFIYNDKLTSSQWLSMMYSRLLLARELLREDGCIFISIDDHEQHRLRMICDAVFGEGNFVGTFPVRKRSGKSDVPFGVSQDYHWMLLYAATNQFAAQRPLARKYYTSADFADSWRLQPLTKQCTATQRPNSFFDIVNPKTGQVFCASEKRVWSVTRDTFPKYLERDKIVFPGDYDFLNITKPMFRVFKREDIAKKGKDFGTASVSTHIAENAQTQEKTSMFNGAGTKELQQLFGEGKVFDFPKPLALIKFVAQITTKEYDLILDFFAGSCTTAHAVMQLNAEDGGNRRWIMVQLDEPCNPKSEAFKSGYKTIADIGKERIRRAIKQVHGESSKVGFRVLKVREGL